MVIRRILRLLLALVFLLPVGITGARATGAASSTSPTAVIQWNAIAVHVVVDLAHQNPTEALISLAYPQAAVYDAVDAIQGGYQPYALNLAPRPSASIDAAVAAAAFLVLDHYFPAQHAVLAADYAASLAAVPDGVDKTLGVSVGTEAANGIIAVRAGDGYEANIGFVMPNPGPGVWQLRPGAVPVAPWASKMRPFMLESQDQFRTSPPPDLTSTEWAVEFNEVKTMGRYNSIYRTPEQTDTALFWSTNPPKQFSAVFKSVIANHELDAMQAARLYAMENMTIADALIGCWDSKYHYLFWRPFTAISQADTDGNPDTVADPTWNSLIAAPNHPEYPSAHGCASSALAQTLSEFLGTEHVNVDFTSAVPGLLQSVRHYDKPTDITQDVINARVWSGIHYRESVIHGVDLGRKVAQWALARYFLPSN